MLYARQCVMCSRALPICVLGADRIDTRGALGNEGYDEDHDHPDIGFDVTRDDSSLNRGCSTGVASFVRGQL